MKDENKEVMQLISGAILTTAFTYTMYLLKPILETGDFIIMFIGNALMLIFAMLIRDIFK